MASDQSFDPRFDPTFQRGFDAMAAGSMAAGPLEAAPVLPIVEGSGRVEQVGRVPVERAVVERAEALFVREPGPSLRGNPWIRVLWMTALLLAAAGAAAQYFAQRITYAPTAPTAAIEYVVPAMLSALSPWLFAVGLATGVATMVIHALRWYPGD